MISVGRIHTEEAEVERGTDRWTFYGWNTVLETVEKDDSYAQRDEGGNFEKRQEWDLEARSIVNEHHVAWNFPKDCGKPSGFDQDDES